MEDIEYMVNKNADVRSYTRQRIAEKKRERRLKKLLLCSGLFAAVTIGAVILGSLGAIHDLLTVIVSVVSAMAGFFTFGLYVATVRRK